MERQTDTLSQLLATTKQINKLEKKIEEHRAIVEELYERSPKSYTTLEESHQFSVLCGQLQQLMDTRSAILKKIISNMRFVGTSAAARSIPNTHKTTSSSAKLIVQNVS